MRLFTKVKEIKSRSGDLHFERFAIIETSIFSIYVHKIHKEDKDLHLHSHPWNFFSVILKGSYVEKYSTLDIFLDSMEVLRLKGFMTVSIGDKTFFHKIEKIVSGPVWTLFISWGKKEPWYYLVDGNKVESEEYRKIKNSVGFK